MGYSAQLVDEEVNAARLSGDVKGEAAHAECRSHKPVAQPRFIFSATLRGDGREQPCVLRRARELLQALKKSAVGSDDGVDRHDVEIPCPEPPIKAIVYPMVQSISDTRTRVVLGHIRGPDGLLAASTQ